MTRRKQALKAKRRIQQALQAQLMLWKSVFQGREVKPVDPDLEFSEAENGVEEKKKASKSPTAQSPTPSVEADSPDQKKIISLRSKSSSDGASLAGDKNDCKTESKNDPKTERKKSSSSSQYKANMHFHKLFLNVPTEEPLRQSFTCALQKEILYQGKLFVSENWICFHSKVFGKDTKISIPAFSVTLIKKTKTALLVPNALIIATVTDRYIFVSLLSRDSTYKLLRSVCGHLENTSVGNSPNPSSTENSFREDRPSSLPLDFNDEFSDLDGVVQQRMQDMEGYSSSGSQTPESENSRDFHVTESQTVLNVSKGEAKPTRADAHVNRVPEGKAKSLPAHGQSETVGILHKVKSQKCLMLHHILIFYAIVFCLLLRLFFLRLKSHFHGYAKPRRGLSSDVCALIISTFYMRYRINTLEERLGLLTSIVDTHNTAQTAPSGLRSQVQFNVEVLCQELTANIVKLEKNNLQKLLENGD
ncbi:GRAM domain-containing protein 2B isoform X3 [Callithrix jacchus]|uniref:GRAM domain-containing protein 2B isoform X3 n=1 Tax=Callithrix jacchus TaxID=9483 RepID=UPI0023DCF2EB|nr:GRAM domain-containing protein 2B isoform X3 [Callithrix jacchus]